MRIAVPRETAAGERRVALVPENVARLVKPGHEVRCSSAAPAPPPASPTPPTRPRERGSPPTRAAVEGAEVVASVRAPAAGGGGAAARRAPSSALLAPGPTRRLLARLAARGVTALAMELVPRITRAQSMDVLSSQAPSPATRRCCSARRRCPKFLPMLTTAAGTLAPAKVFVIGAGVAGLQAIATARRLGGVVSAFDVRPAAREQVLSPRRDLRRDRARRARGPSGGYAKELGAERAGAARTRAARDAHQGHGSRRHHGADPRARRRRGSSPRTMVATHAAGLGDRRPRGRDRRQLRAHPRRARRSSRPGVTIIGPVNLPATVPFHASQMFGRNVLDARSQHLSRRTAR